MTDADTRWLVLTTHKRTTSLREAARVAKVDPTTARRILDDAGVKRARIVARRNGRRVLTAADDREVSTRYLRGQSIDTLSIAFGVSVLTLRRSLDRTGTPRRPRGRPRSLAARQCSWCSATRHLVVDDDGYACADGHGCATKRGAR